MGKLGKVATFAAPAYPRPELPRLLFSGKFFADPSTVNNDVQHFDTENFRPNYQLPQDELNANGWNPDGTGMFSLVDCTVTGMKTSESVQTPMAFNSESDTLMSKSIIGNDSSVQAKMVDIDPQLQLVSQIYGLNVGIGDETTGFSSTMEMAPFRDLWGSLKGAQGMPAQQAVYQGVLKLSSFSAGSSTFLQECAPYVTQSMSMTDDGGDPVFPEGALSIRFTLRSFNADRSGEDFRYGVVTGVIQPYLAGEPYRFDTGRVMLPVDLQSAPAMNAYAYVQETSSGYSLYVDLINSLQYESKDSFVDVGTLSIATKNVTTGSYTTLGTIDYLSTDWVSRTGGIVEFPLSATQKSTVESSPLAILAASNVLLEEDANGYFVRADQFVYRLDPDSTDTCQLYAMQYGQRLPEGKTLTVGFYTPPDLGSDVPPVGTPQSGLVVNGVTPTDGQEFSTRVTTDSEGVAALTITGGDPQNSRGYLDRQIYALRCAVGSSLPPQASLNDLNVSDNINVLVYDSFTAPATPSWLVDIYPIFKQYANLYPSMARVVTLDDYGSCVDRRVALLRAFGASEDDPHYMPVTRDLSTAKRDMIISWLQNVDADGKPLFMDTGDVANLMAALQTAIELEHSTIPLYLTALYSIKEGYNQYAARAIRDVVSEEMLHFGLACNLLISIGGTPNISKIGFVPKYPGPLPGGLRQGLIVHLRKLSRDQLRTFMSIEAPDQQYLAEDGAVDGDEALQTNDYTIGFLYKLVEEALDNLYGSQQISFPDDDPGNTTKLDNQVEDTWGAMGSLTKVKNLADAKQAIELIMDQGEGSSPTMPTDGDIDPSTGLPELSHYFRFAEIAKGQRLVSTATGFKYDGPVIRLDEDGIYNMQDDPNVKFLPPGSQARERMEAFSRKYQAMLNGLHKTFNGSPDYLTQAVAAMFQIAMSAKPLMEMPNITEDGTPKDDGTTVGISFQMPFSN